MQKFPVELLRNWFELNARSLPWRESISPYKVWVSEIMLQQTQVAVVAPYFNQWMDLFPTIERLAHAPIEQVIKCWEGLGYYSRARHLHQAAQQIMEHFGGKIPEDPLLLAKIKGVGPYTQGALRSFAFHHKVAAVDGNVLRVLSRFLGFSEEIEKARSKIYLQKYADGILPERQPWVISEALIELGATVCMKKARCEKCPLKKECIAYAYQTQDQLPKRKARPKTIHLQREVAVIFHGQNYLVQKAATGRVMAGLYEFPYREKGEGDCVGAFEELLGCELEHKSSLKEQKHTFTRYQVTLFPHLFEAKEQSGMGWTSFKDLSALPFSSGHRKILRELLEI
ncbi:MAG: Adenine DNA glycosylase [Chlamydiales bacterium]|nr:Adenine DNA glycosylase [Chlamydiales bacterium]